jgi:hypothetical protein
MAFSYIATKPRSLCFVWCSGGLARAPFVIAFLFNSIWSSGLALVTAILIKYALTPLAQSLTVAAHAQSLTVAALRSINNMQLLLF